MWIARKLKKTSSSMTIMVKVPATSPKFAQ